MFKPSTTTTTTTTRNQTTKQYHGYITNTKSKSSATYTTTHCIHDNTDGNTEALLPTTTLCSSLSLWMSRSTSSEKGRAPKGESA